MKKAFLVGINKYPGSPLRGCVNDVIVVFQILTTKFDFKPENIKVLTDQEATRANIISGIKWLTQGVKVGDSIVFHYSGHGSQVMVDDWSATNETDGRDEIICPVDLDWNDPLRDHELGAYFKRVPKTCETLVILDCCLSKDTKIPLLNGTTKTIEELSKIKDDYWVYSSTEDGKLVPGLAHSARITGHRELIRITLDNNEVFECTDDHRIMLKNGTYKEAGKLTTEDSLMPLYRKISTESDGLVGYEMCFIDNKWEFTHRIVRDHFELKNGLTRDKTICHHKDINKLNNIPENLEMVTWGEHSKMNKDPKMAEKQRAWQKTEDGKLKLKNDMLSKNKDPKHQLKCMRARVLGFINTLSDLNEYDTKKPQLLPKLENLHKYFDKNEDIMELAGNYNHKIISIERTGKIEDVYDLTVEKYHNFAIDSGVIVHNCHSGTGLRNGFEPGTKFTDMDYVNRFISPPLSNILTNPSVIINEDLSFDFNKCVSSSKTSPFLVDTIDQGNAILISGCKDNQTSADAWINQKYQGAMTYALAATLSKHNFVINYHDLITDMSKLLKDFKFEQEPQLECHKILFKKPFLV